MPASTYAEVARYLDSDETISRADLRRWMDSGDLLTWGAIYELTRTHPGLLGDEELDFTRRYLLRCIEENPPSGDYLHGGYEAAWELAACLKQWRADGGRAAKALRGIALDLDKMYRRADDATRNRILCGVLEHAFEDPAVRPYFVDWERDEELREAHKLAMEWGSAHQEFGVRQLAAAFESGGKPPHSKLLLAHHHPIPLEPDLESGYAFRFDHHVFQ